jgi:hypothetical protein
MAELTILEPISTGDVIDRSVRLYRKNFIPLVSVVAVPTLIYYVSAMMVSFGYAQTLQNAETGFAPLGAMMTLFGLAGYVAYLFTILGAVSGMSRAIGDYMMLGEPITFKGCWRFAIRRLGDVALMGLIFIPVLMIIGGVMFVAMFVLFFGLALTIGAGAGVGLPSWLGAIAATILIIGSAFLFVSLLLLVAARFVFVPCAAMIEGRSAAAAFGRAFQLGGGRTWYRLGMIAAFSYFVSLSILAALVEPLLVIFAINGWQVADLLLHPGWNAAYAAVNQISTLLVWPIWIGSLTLLYFDSRVRGEGYDIELMTSGLPQPAYAHAAAMPPFGPQWNQPQPARPYMQTGPLGLGGYPVVPSHPSLPYSEVRPIQYGAHPLGPPPLGSPPNSAWPPETRPTETHPGAVYRVPENGPAASGDSASTSGQPDFNPRPTQGTGLDTGAGSRLDPGGRVPLDYAMARQPAAGPGAGGPPVKCSVCGLVALPGARYCIACGDLLQTEEPTPAEGPGLASG